MLEIQANIVDFLRKVFLFSELEDSQIFDLASEIELKTFDDGAAIYQQGENANHFFIVWSGEVKLKQKAERQERILTTFSLGDFFGEDLIHDTKRRETAVVKGSTKVLRFRKDTIHQLMDKYPNLKRIIQATAHSRRFAYRKKFKWLREGESVYFVTRKHGFFLAVELFLPTLLGIFLAISMGWVITNYSPFCVGVVTVGLVVCIAVILWLWLDWSNDYYLVTSQRAMWVEKIVLLYDSQQEAPINTVLSTNITKNQILGWFIDYGTVIIKTYTGSIEMQRSSTPTLLVGYIDGLQARGKELSKYEETEAMEEELSRRLNPVEVEKPSPATSAQPIKNTEKPLSGLRKVITTFIKMRYEDGTTITYRKHWFVLIKKTWIQAILLVVLSVGLIYLINTEMLNIVNLLLWLFVFVGIFLWWLYQFIDWQNDIYVLTLENILDIERKPLSREVKKSASLENILSLEHTRLGLIGLLLNYGTVRINIGTEQFNFFYVYNPAQVQYEIFDRMTVLRYRKEQIQAAKERERIVDWLAIYHKKTETLEELENHTRQGKNSE